MTSPIPALIFGISLIIAGILMILAQKRGAQNLDRSNSNDQTFRFEKSRIRRRIQIAGLIVIIGFMIPLGDSLIPWRQAPGTFAIYWMIVLGLAGWTMLLAIGDMAATKTQMSRELRQLNQRHRELQSIAHKLKQAMDQNSPRDE